MAIAQKKIGSMQQLKEDFAAVRSVADLFRLRAASDPQRVAAVRKISGVWKPLTWAELAGSAEVVGDARLDHVVDDQDVDELVG